MFYDNKVVDERNYIQEIKNVSFSDNSNEALKVAIKCKLIFGALVRMGFGKVTMAQFSLAVLSMIKKDQNVSSEELVKLIDQYDIDKAILIHETEKETVKPN